MKRHALIIALLFCAAAARGQSPADSGCGASPAADACVAMPKTAGLFGLPLPAAGTEQPREKPEAEKSGPASPRPAEKQPAGKAAQVLPALQSHDTSLPRGSSADDFLDLSGLERASNALHLWLGLALAVLALTEAFAAGDTGSRTLPLTGCGLAAALALGSLAAAALTLGPETREILAFKPGFLLYFAAVLLTASAALSQLLSRHSGNGGGFWGGASAFFLAAAGTVLLAVQARVNPEASHAVMAGHVPISAALLAAGAARGFLLFTAAKPARAALPVFLFIAAAMSGLYRENPGSFSLHFTTVTDDAGAPLVKPGSRGAR